MASEWSRPEKSFGLVSPQWLIGAPPSAPFFPELTVRRAGGDRLQSPQSNCVARCTMISREYCQLMASYNRWMNQRLYAVCSEFSDAERRRDRGAFFSS